MEVTGYPYDDYDGSDESFEKLTGCPICDSLSAPPSHPNYPNPEPGDEWHGQYNVNNPQAVYDAMTNALAQMREEGWAGAGFNRRNEESAGVQLEFDFGEYPWHDYNMPHDVRYMPGTGGCPPNCPARLGAS